MIHEGNKDIGLAHIINDNLKIKIPIIKEQNPLFVKGIISECTSVITSRFHGLVSCLSQGIPCLATGWSHKYEMVLKDYNYDEGLVHVDASDEVITEKMNTILDKTSRTLIREKLLEESKKQKLLSQGMWQQVFKVITQ